MAQGWIEAALFFPVYDSATAALPEAQFKIQIQNSKEIIQHSTFKIA